MDGLSALILALVLEGTPLVLQPLDRPCSDQLPSPAIDLELELSPLANASQRLEALVAETMYLSPSGWLGVQLRPDLAVLLDARVDNVASSPDPARPDPREALSARIGIELRTAI